MQVVVALPRISGSSSASLCSSTGRCTLRSTSFQRASPYSRIQWSLSKRTTPRLIGPTTLRSTNSPTLPGRSSKACSAPEPHQASIPNLQPFQAYVPTLPQRLTLPPRRYLGYRPPHLAHADLPVRIPAPSQSNSVTAIDWRSNGCVNAIQNQVRCAHAACRRR